MVRTLGVGGAEVLEHLGDAHQRRLPHAAAARGSRVLPLPPLPPHPLVLVPVVVAARLARWLGGFLRCGARGLAWPAAVASSTLRCCGAPRENLERVETASGGRKEFGRTGTPDRWAMTVGEGSRAWRTVWKRARSRLALAIANVQGFQVLRPKHPWMMD